MSGRQKSNMKKFRRIVLIAILLSSIASPVQAIELEGRPQPYQRFLDKAKVPTPDVQAGLILEACPWGLFFACTTQAPYTIYLQPAKKSRRDIFPLRHEVAHIYDDMYFGKKEHKQFAAIFGRKWKGVMAELFADVYAKCARTHRVKRPYFSVYFRAVTRRQHRKGCKFIIKTGGLRGW